MNKHIFFLPKSQPLPGSDPNWIGFICKFCGHISGLDAWQIRDMPINMAECNKSPIRIGFFEGIKGSINCFGKSPTGDAKKGEV
jgi:hypothetical protein